jgi:hypothetical protein
MINYKKGGKPVKLENSKVVVDPRSETSFRGKSHLAVGNTNPVRKGKAARKQKDVTWV